MKKILSLDTQDFVVYGVLKMPQVDVEFTLWAEKSADRVTTVIDKEKFDLVAMLSTNCSVQWQQYFESIEKPIRWVGIKELEDYINQYRYSGHYAYARALADFASESYIF